MKRQTAVPAMAGALASMLTLFSPVAFADQQPQGPVSVTVTNTASNPVPTKPQGTTQVSGVVDVLSMPPVTGSVSVANAPTVNLAPGSTVAVSGSVSIANQPAVSLAPNTAVEIAAGLAIIHLFSWIAPPCAPSAGSRS